MHENKNAHPTAATVEQAGTETAAYGRAAISFDYSITATPDRQLKVSAFLSYGQGNAVPLRQLVSITGLDGRSVRLMIQAERLAGVPILADNSTGYYLPENEGERERFVRSMRHRAGEIMRVAKAIEGAGG